MRGTDYAPILRATERYKMFDYIAKTGMSRDEIESNIQSVFDKATPAIIAQGATWYDEAKAVAEEMVNMPFISSIEHAAWVIAAMSPRMFWGQNVKAALHYAATGKRLAGLMTRSYDKACAFATDFNGDFANLAKSGKTPAFAANICGDDSRVTVDVWAARVAGIDEKILNRVGVYEAIAECYVSVALRNGVTPAQCQAITWIVQRNGRAQ